MESVRGSSKSILRQEGGDQKDPSKIKHVINHLNNEKSDEIKTIFLSGTGTKLNNSLMKYCVCM